MQKYFSLDLMWAEPPQLPLPAAHPAPAKAVAGEYALSGYSDGSRAVALPYTNPANGRTLAGSASVAIVSGEATQVHVTLTVETTGQPNQVGRLLGLELRPTGPGYDLLQDGKKVGTADGTTLTLLDGTDTFTAVHRQHVARAVQKRFAFGRARPAALAVAASLLSLALPLTAQAQANDPLLFVGSSAGIGVGSYNPTGFVTSLDLRYQQPIAPRFSLTARTGGEFFLIKKAFRYTYVPLYSYGYGYSGYYEKGPGSGFSVPITIGPRYYFANGLHADLNLGADIGVTAVAATAFRFEPGMGYAIPLANGRYADLSLSFITSFARGSGAFSFNFAYGLNLGSRRAPAPRAAVSPTYAPAPGALPRAAAPVVPRRSPPRSSPRRTN